MTTIKQAKKNVQQNANRLNKPLVLIVLRSLINGKVLGFRSVTLDQWESDLNMRLSNELGFIAYPNE